MAFVDPDGLAIMVLSFLENHCFLWIHGVTLTRRFPILSGPHRTPGLTSNGKLEILQQDIGELSIPEEMKCSFVTRVSPTLVDSILLSSVTV